MIKEPERFYKVTYRRQPGSSEQVYMLCNNIAEAMEGMKELERECVVFMRLEETTVTTLSTREMVPFYKVEEARC